MGREKSINETLMAGKNIVRNKTIRLEIRKQDVLGIKWQDHVGSTSQSRNLSETNEVFKEGVT